MTLIRELRRKWTSHCTMCVSWWRPNRT